MQFWEPWRKFVAWSPNKSRKFWMLQKRWKCSYAHVKMSFKKTNFCLILYLLRKQRTPSYLRVPLFIFEFWAIFQSHFLPSVKDNVAVLLRLSFVAFFNHKAFKMNLILKFSTTIVESGAFFLSLGHLGHPPKQKHTSFPCNFIVFHCVNHR